MVENFLHKRFSDGRLEGEWFKPDQFDYLEIEDKMQDIQCCFTRTYLADEAKIFRFIPSYPWTK